MLSNGFKINECDKCVYGNNNHNSFAILCLYVDNMLIMGSGSEVVKVTKRMLVDT